MGIFFLINSAKGKAQEQETNEPTLPKETFGFTDEEHTFETHKLGFNQNLGDLLLWQGISWDSIIKLDKISSDVYSIRNFRAKKPFTLVKKDSCAAPHCVVYEPDHYHYIKYLSLIHI